MLGPFCGTGEYPPLLEQWAYMNREGSAGRRLPKEATEPCVRQALSGGLTGLRI